MSLIDLLIPTALAAGGTQTTGSQSFMSFLPMLLLLVAFMYLLIIRPQSKRTNEHKKLMSKLQKGDEILTIGGMLGRIEKISDNFVQISVADNIVITIQKAAIANCMPKGTIKSV